MAKSWAGFDVVLLVGQPVKTALESQEAWIARLRRQREIIKAYRAGLSRPPGPEPELHPGHSGPTGAETAWAARLTGQREIIKAYRAGLSRWFGPELYPGHAGPRLLDVWQELAKGASASCN